MVQVVILASLLLAWRHVMGFQEEGVPSRWRFIDLLPQSQTPLYLIGRKTCGNVCHVSMRLGVCR